MTSRKWVGPILGLSVIAGALLWFYGSTKGATGVSEKELITVQRVDYPLLVTTSGTLFATRSVTIGPPSLRRENRFKLTRIVDEGTIVSEGDFVMEFDATTSAENLRTYTTQFQNVQEEIQKKRSDSNLSLQQARLNIEQVRANYEKLDSKLAQIAGLESAITIEETRIQRDAAKKNLESLEKKLKYQSDSMAVDLQISRSNEQFYRDRMDTMNDAIDSLVVRAPIDGIVIYKRNFNNEAKEIGSFVGSMESVVEIPDLSTIRVKLLVDETDAGKIQPGQEVNIIVDAFPGRIFGGTVASTSTILKQATYDRPLKIIETYADFDDKNLKELRPGMTAKAQIRVGQYNQVLVIPLSSIQEISGRSFVQMWNAEKKNWEWREIELTTSDSTAAVVKSGLQASDKIRAKPKL
jgi:HlyD family secretion protein